MSFLIEWAALSDTGRQREHNEDSFLADEEEALWVVADGMGGHQGGEEASQIAVQCVHHFMVELRYDPAFGGRFVQDNIYERPLQDFASSIRYANERIFIEAMKDPAKEGMGTTIVAAARHGEGVILAWVGDSRIYRFRSMQLEQVSRDHSLLNHLLATGQLSPDRAESFTQTNVILRALGLRDSVEVDVRWESFEDGDIYLLCSDGLSDMVDDLVMRQVLREAGHNLNLACQKLIQLANANGGKDNITVCLIKSYLLDQPTFVL